MQSERWRRWLVHTNKIYIIPSRRGFLFLAAIVVMVLAGATYNNNLVFLLAFYMFAVFVVAMLQTHYNLKGVRLTSAQSAEGFVGEPILVLVVAQQKRARRKRQLVVQAHSRDFKNAGRVREDLAPGALQASFSLSLVPRRRGLHPMPELILETHYPLGLFRAWKVFRLNGEICVYPKPHLEQRLSPRPDLVGQEEQGLQRSPDGDFGELKNYRLGESYHQIAWKHYARSRDLYSKVHWGEEPRHYLIPWAVQSRADFEAALERMSGWVQQALDESASFAMQTPTGETERAAGVEHARRCWRLLAEAKEPA